MSVPLLTSCSHWCDGYQGALAVGLQPSLYYPGCDEMLFVLLPLGLMNVGAMGLATLLVVVEKAPPFGRLVHITCATGLLLYGPLAFLRPEFPPDHLR